MVFVSSPNLRYQDVGLSLKEYATFGLTQVFRYLTTKCSEVLKCSANFSAAQWLEFCDTGRKIFTTGR